MLSTTPDFHSNSRDSNPSNSSSRDSQVPTNNSNIIDIDSVVHSTQSQHALRSALRTPSSTHNSDKHVAFTPSDIPLLTDDQQFKHLHSDKFTSFYKHWSSFVAARYSCDTYPLSITEQHHDLNKIYRAIPEIFYSRSGLPVITPDNCIAWITHMLAKGICKALISEVFSGSGILSHVAYSRLIPAIFPID